MMERPWGTSWVKEGQLVELSAKDNARVGNSWMKGRLLDGDLAIVESHSGDHFYYYNLVSVGRSFVRKDKHLVCGAPTYQLIEHARFGGYTLGKPYKFQPTNREMHLILAGEVVKLESEIAQESEATG